MCARRTTVGSATHCFPGRLWSPSFSCPSALSSTSRSSMDMLSTCGAAPAPDAPAPVATTGVPAPSAPTAGVPDPVAPTLRDAVADDLSLTTMAPVGSAAGSVVGFPTSAARSSDAGARSLGSVITASSLGIPAAAAAAEATTATAMDDRVASATGRHVPFAGSSVALPPAPTTDEVAAGSRHPPTPRTSTERLSFFLRYAFRLRTRRDASIFSFMSIAVVAWKLDCLAALNNCGDRKLLRARLLELFSDPVAALRFLEETFGVGDRGMHLGGRLAAHKHVSGQPASFPSQALRAVTNPDMVIGEWMSRNLCTLEELSLSASGAHDRGLSVAEVAALGARLRSPALVREAHKVGCVVHFDGDQSNNTLGPSKLLFNWNFSLDDDDDLTALLRVLRPVLLKFPPNSLTRALRVPVAVAGSSSVVGDVVPVEAGGGRPPAGVVVIPGTDPTGGHLSGVKRKAAGGAAGQSNLPGASPTAKPRRVAVVKSARCTVPTAAMCACSPSRSVGGGQSWLVAEIRKTCP